MSTVKQNNDTKKGIKKWKKKIEGQKNREYTKDNKIRRKKLRRGSEGKIEVKKTKKRKKIEE